MVRTARLYTLLTLWLWVACGTGAARADNAVGESELKAAYVFNFIEFIEWPNTDGSADGDVNVCVSAFSPLRRALTGLEGKNTSRGRTVKIMLLDTAAVRACRVLILHNTDAEPALRTLRSLPPGHGILTISDEVTFVNPDIVIALTQQQGRVVFGISAEAASRAGLTISSRLMRLAKGPR